MDKEIWRDEVVAWLETAGSDMGLVCPFARKNTPIEFLPNDQTPSRTETEVALKEIVDRFLDVREQVILLVSPHTTDTHVDGRKEAKILYRGLNVVGDLLYDRRDHANSQAFWGNFFVPLIADHDFSFGGPTLETPSGPLIVSGFTSLHRDIHPRHAPHVLYPIIKWDFLERVRKQDRAKQHEVMRKSQAKLIIAHLDNAESIDVAGLAQELDVWERIRAFHMVRPLYEPELNAALTEPTPQLLASLKSFRADREREISSTPFYSLCRGELERDGPPYLRRILKQNPQVPLHKIFHLYICHHQGLYVC